MDVVHGATWMHSAIPHSPKVIAPLHKLPELQLNTHEKQKKSWLLDRPVMKWTRKEGTLAVWGGLPSFTDHEIIFFMLLKMRFKSNATSRVVHKTQRRQ